MASNQYNFPPPPPPPSQHSGSPSGYQSYPPNPYGQSPARGGATDFRGRGGYNSRGRGGYQSTPPTQHYGPPPGNGGYGQQSPAPYIGPQGHPPTSAPTSSYPPPSWGQPAGQNSHNQHHPHGPPIQMQHQPAPAPAPLSAQNYHPNYAPQVYQQPQPQSAQSQYGPQQPAFQHSPGPNTYGQHGPPPPQHQPAAPSQQWQGPPPQQGHSAYDGANRGRGRGGPVQTQGRGSFNAPLMGPPIRMGFDGERSGEPKPPVGSNYTAPYQNAVQSSPPVPSFSTPSYPGASYPPQQTQGFNGNNRGPPSNRGPLEPNPFPAQGMNYHRGEHRNDRAGRGGGHHRGRDHRNDRDGRNGRDHRDHGFNDRNRNHRFGGRDNRHGNSSHNSTHSSASKPVSAGINKASEGRDKKKKKKKRKTNTLGLTPATEEHEASEEEDDADEESRLAGTATLTEVPSDLEAWLAERRRKWPTAARRAAKEAELAKRRAQAAEQSARDKAKAKKEREELTTVGVKADKESEMEKMQRKAEKLRKQLERVEREMQDDMKVGMKRKRDSNDSGDDESAVKHDGSDLVDQVIAKVTAGTKFESEGSSEYTDASDSDDDPEEQTSHRTGPTRVQPPHKKTILERQCKYFSTGGTCGKKGKCRFIHDQSVRDAALREKDLNGGRITLSQRMIQNDSDKEHLFIIKSIKHLQEKGLLEENGPSGQQDGMVNIDHENVTEEQYGSDT